MQDHVNELMEENHIYMTEDILDEYIQDFTQRAYEIKDNLATNAHQGFIEFESFLTRTRHILLEKVEELRTLNNHRVDNTRK